MNKENQYNTEEKEKIDEELEELKKQFFVDTDSFEDRNLKEYVQRLMKFSKMTPDGQILIEQANLSDADMISVITLTYYLGNKLNSKIDDTVNLKTLTEFTKIENKIISAQISRLIRKRLLVRQKTGVYKFNPRKITEFLDKLESQSY